MSQAEALTNLPLDKKSIERLLSSSISHDKVVLTRMMDMLKLATERDWTVREFADYYEMHYQTIYKNIQILVHLDLLQVTPTRRGRSICYITNWKAIKDYDGELRWVNKDGEWEPISIWLGKFAGVSPDMARSVTTVRDALIGLWENNRRIEAELPHYGYEFNKQCQELVIEWIEVIDRVRYVLDQIAVSPIWDEADSHKMFNVPEKFLERDPETGSRFAEVIHNKLQLSFVGAVDEE